MTIGEYGMTIVWVCGMTTFYPVAQAVFKPLKQRQKRFCFNDSNIDETQAMDNDDDSFAAGGLYRPARIKQETSQVNKNPGGV